jgi:hypothetical protein
MKVSQFKEGNLYYSTTTEILYKVVKGELFKFPLYSTNSDRQWAKAGYSGNHSHFEKAKKKHIDSLKSYGGKL